MNAIARQIIAISLLVFGALVLFANVALFTHFMSYESIMKVVGLTISGTALYLAIKFIPQLNKEA